MPEKIYQAFNGVQPSTAAQVAVTTGTAIKTLLQLATPSTCPITIIEWGISFDGSAAATPIKVELLNCTGAATVTAFTASTDLIKFNDPGLPTSLLTVGTTASGYTASGEGTAANVRELDVQFIAPTNQYVKQFPLGREPSCAVSTFVRVRVTAGAAVNAYCYVIWSE
jgi:hypothetical protein